MLADVEQIQANLPKWGAWDFGWIPVLTVALVLLISLVWRNMAKSNSAKASKAKS
jgi:hypothetical protein